MYVNKASRTLDLKQESFRFVSSGKQRQCDRVQVYFGDCWLSDGEVVQTHSTDREAGTTKCC